VKFSERSSRGFTLLELITVITVVSIIAVYTSSRSSSVSWSELQTSRDNLIAALFHAQQVAMARDGAGSQVTFVATNSSTFRVQLENADIGQSYPFNFANNVVLTSPVAFPFTLNYDKLGRTSATTFTLSGGGTTINVILNGSGYAY